MIVISYSKLITAVCALIMPLMVTGQPTSSPCSVPDRQTNAVAQKTADGRALCATAQPTETVTVLDKLRCLLTCLDRATCDDGFNYRSDSKRCEFYSDQPVTYEEQSNCNYYFKVTEESGVDISTRGRQFYQLGASYLDVGVTLTGRTWLTLQLRAASVAQVGLTPQQGVYPNDHIYEIVLRGGNSFANIRKSHLTKNVASAHTTNIVSGNEFRWFWISWKDGKLSVGRGNRVGVDVFMSYEDPTPSPVNYLAVGSYADNDVYSIIPYYLY